MNTDTFLATCLGLLHEIGRILDQDTIRSLIDDEEILNNLLYFSYQKEATSGLPANSICHLVNMADRIVTRAELHPDEGQDIEKLMKKIDRTKPLYAVFNNLNISRRKDRKSFYYQPWPLSENINYPTDKPGYKLSEEDYSKLAKRLKDELSNINFRQKSVNSLLSILENTICFIPSNIMQTDTADIPLYDHCKMTAAIASCIQEYLSYNKRTDYAYELTNEEAFCTEKVFLMLSGDFSGIQSFIYNIASEGALKSLRSRSFFLELTMEHIVDELLKAGGVSRANLIYSGGGHCYILLPNTARVKENIDNLLVTVNKWLRKGFGTRLYYAGAYTECSANDLMNIPFQDAPYEQIFRSLSRSLSAIKMTRYTPEELIELNSSPVRDGTRECRVCGTENRLLKSDDICYWCNSFERLSNTLLQKDLAILISRQETPEFPHIKLPGLTGELFCYFANTGDAEELKNAMNIERIYTKNRSCPQLTDSIRLYMGDYVFNGKIDRLINENGPRRIAIMRADVDNLGLAFISGFTRPDENSETKNRYNTLSRTAAFSRQLSLFFKYHINFLLEGKEGSYHIQVGNEHNEKKKVVTVYSGGDDVFLIGGLKDILESVILLQNAFSRYTCNSLSISFGIGLFPVKYPIYRSAVETEELESLAKQNEDKNSISLFSVKGDHIYKLDTFKNKVLEDKLVKLNKFFSYNSETRERGNSFLFRLMQLIKNSDDRINIARYAFLLARLEPSGGNEEYRQLYNDFSKVMYDWILKPADRKELLTAIYIYIYLTRKRSEQ